MSETKIKDGVGSGYVAKVDPGNRLYTRSTTESDEQHAISEGQTWNITSGEITLTDTAASALQYVKNTGTVTLIIPIFILLTKASTGGSGGVAKVEILRNPTSGTVVSDASAGTNVNHNFGSSNTPAITHYVGAEGKTLTGQDDIMNSQTSDASRLPLTIITFLPTGASVGIRITPPASNSSMVVESIMEIYEAE